jgi:hypothetical protein
MPPQTVVALYIYRVGRSCPTRNPFTARNLQGLLNSTWTRGPSVRPVTPTGQTGVAVVGSTTRHSTGQTVEEHRSERRRQPDRPCAKFGCEQCVYLYELKKLGKYQKLRFPYKFVFFQNFSFMKLHEKIVVCLIF